MISRISIFRVLSVSLSILMIVVGCSCDDNPVDPARATSLVAIGGDYYKGVMGESGLTPTLEFGVRDQNNKLMAGQWIHFSLIEGDGSFVYDSVLSGENGKIEIDYSFDGDFGHAVIRASKSGLDSIDVILRANTLIPGTNGQGQYVMITDTYGDVVGLNGTPDQLDIIPDFAEIMVANYEASLGVVFIIYDTNLDGAIENPSPVFAAVVVDSIYPQLPDSTTFSARYEGTTADSIGIGSKLIPDIINSLGGAYTMRSDAEWPPSWVVVYTDLNLTFWCHLSDTSAFQIDIAEEFDTDLYPATISEPDHPDNRSDRILQAVRKYYSIH